MDRKWAAARPLDKPGQLAATTELMNARGEDDFMTPRQAAIHGAGQDPMKSLIVAGRSAGFDGSTAKAGQYSAVQLPYNGVTQYPPMVYFDITDTYGDHADQDSRMNA